MQVLQQLVLLQGVEKLRRRVDSMAIEWHEASTKFKIAWLSCLIGAPVLSVIIWRLQIPYVEIYLIIIAIAAWTAAILYRRRKKTMTEEVSMVNDHERIQ